MAVKVQPLQNAPWSLAEVERLTPEIVRLESGRVASGALTARA